MSASVRRRVLAVLVAVTAWGTVAALGSTVPAASAAPRAGAPSGPAATSASTYLVEAADASAATRVATKAESLGAKVTRRYTTVLHGFAASMTAAQAASLRAQPGVVTVVADQKIIANPCLDCPPDPLTREFVKNWGLLRLSSRAKVSLTPDQPDGPLYVGDSDGAGVTAFVLDSGIDAGQAELAGRVQPGYDFVSGDADAADCSGHGTQVGEVIGGDVTGVAAAVRLVPLRVFDCGNAGVWSNVVAALDWAVNHRPAGPAVVNLSGAGHAFALGDEAVSATIKAGLPVVVSAGNVHDSACRYSPARVGAALTVAGSSISDGRARNSNYGSCVDLFAAGQDVATTSGTVSGTSFAAAHVSGAVARYLENHRGATPAQITAYLLGNATKDALAGTAGSPNRLLYLPPPVAPGAPRALRTSVDDAKNTVSVSWLPPADPGSAPVTSYQVCLLDVDVFTHSPGGQCVQTPATARTVTLGAANNVAIEDGSVYDVRVAAVSKGGSGLAYQQVRFAHALASAPSIDVIADEETGGMLVRIHPPEDDFFAGPATGYRFTATNAADPADTQTKVIDTVNDFVEFQVTHGVPYVYTAAVVTADGVGASSGPVTATYPG